MSDIETLRKFISDWKIPAIYGFSENPLRSGTAYSCSISIEDADGKGVFTFEFNRNGTLSKHYAGECRWMMRRPENVSN